MESTGLDAVSILLQPCNPQPNGRIIRMNVHRFIEIYSSFRSGKRREQITEGTSCMDYEESVSTGMMSENAQQTSIETSEQFSQTEVSCFNSRSISNALSKTKRSSIVRPVQRETMPVTATATPLPESRVKVNNGDSATKRRDADGVFDRRLLEVFSRQLMKLKFAGELEKMEHDNADILKKFKSNILKDFEHNELWCLTSDSFASIPHDAVIVMDQQNYTHRSTSRRRCGDASTRRNPIRNEESHRQRNTQHSKHSVDSSRQKRHSDDRSELPPLPPKRAKESCLSRNRSSRTHSSPSKVHSLQSSCSTSKRGVSTAAESRVASRTTYDHMANGKNDTTEAKRAGCYRNPKLSDPRLSKCSTDTSLEYSPTSPTEDGFSSEMEVVDNLPVSQRLNLKVKINKMNTDNSSSRVVVQKKSTESQPCDDTLGKPPFLPSADAKPTSQPSLNNSFDVSVSTNPPQAIVQKKIHELRLCDVAFSETKRISQLSISNSDVECSRNHHTVSEASAVLSNLIKNFPYVQQPVILPKVTKLKRETETAKETHQDFVKDRLSRIDIKQRNSESNLKVKLVSTETSSSPSTDLINTTTSNNNKSWAIKSIGKESLMSSTESKQSTSRTSLANDVKVDKTDVTILKPGLCKQHKCDDIIVVGDDSESLTSSTQENLMTEKVKEIAIPAKLEAKPILKNEKIDKVVSKSDDENVSSNMKDVKEDNLEPGGLCANLKERVYPKTSTFGKVISKENCNPVKQLLSTKPTKMLQAPIKHQKSPRLKTFCIGSPTIWFNRAANPAPSQTYSPISTQITPRLECYDSEQRDDGNWQNNLSKPRFRSEVDCRMTDQYHPPRVPSLFASTFNTQLNHGGYQS